MPTNGDIALLLTLRDEATAQWKKFQGQVSSGFAKIGQQLSRFGGILAGAFSIYAIKSFIEASNAQEQATASLTQALQNQGITSASIRNEMEAFSKEMQRTTTFADEEVTALQATLVSMTGLTGKGVQPLVKAALDLATAQNLDIQSAGILIGKTIAGMDALSRYGVSVKGATTQSEKLQRITEGVAAMFGGRAQAAAATAAGKMKQFGNLVGDLKERFGDIIKEALIPLLPALGGVIRLIEQAPVPIRAATLAVGALTAAFVALHIAMGPIGWALAALTAIGTFAVALINSMKQHQIDLKSQTTSWIAYYEVMADGTKVLKHVKDTMKDMQDVAPKAMKPITNSIGAMEEQLKLLNDEAKKLDPTSKEFKNLAAQIVGLERKLQAAQKMLKPEDLTRVQKEIQKINQDTVKAIEEASKRSALIYQKDEMSRLAIERDYALKQNEEETKILLGNETNAKKRDAILQQSAAKRMGIEVAYADGVVKEEERIRNAVRQADDQITEIHLAMEEARNLATAVTETDRFKIQQEYALKALDLQRNASVLSAAIEGKSVDELLSIFKLFEAKKDELIQQGAIKSIDLHKQEIRETFDAILSYGSRALGLLTQLTDQNAQARIDALETERDAQLAVINDQLNAENLSASKKKALQAQQAAIQKRYDDDIRREKLRAWEADRTAKALQVIINTAEEISKVTATPWMIPIVAALGAAEEAIILSQSPPKFHQGVEAAYIGGPPGRDVPVMVQSGETITVRTPAQQARASSSPSTIHMHFNFNGALTNKEAFKQIVEEGMQEMGVTDVSKFFRNNKHGIVFSTS